MFLKCKAWCSAYCHQLRAGANDAPCATASFRGPAIVSGVGEGQELLSWKQKRTYVQGLVCILWLDFYTTQEASHCEACTIPESAVKRLKTKWFQSPDRKKKVGRATRLYSRTDSWRGILCTWRVLCGDPKEKRMRLPNISETWRGEDIPSCRSWTHVSHAVAFFLQTFWSSFLTPWGLELRWANASNAP